MNTIWVNEQRDPIGLLYSCMASRDESLARACHESFQANLTEEQRRLGWVATLRTVEHWDEVPVNSLKLG